MTKTNVMRLLEQADIPFRTAEYEYDESDLSGNHAADVIGMPREQVFKTLVTRAGKGGIYVFCIPVCDELDLKKAAKACGEKSIEMLHVKELLNVTGYIRGGCSPIGMKKKFPTYIDETAILFDEIAVSAGMRGEQVILAPDALAGYIGAELFELTT
ncbi:MAG: Cys-tRNA(Pro) deacylase [Oscillospiraceae bacterium]|nr:Cys-tRNA(Pro) deacylase [Oscillospiraceae bacterium]